jgi:WD40 repeat protein
VLGTIRRHRKLIARALAVALLPALAAVLGQLTVPRPRSVWKTGQDTSLACFSPDGKTLVTTKEDFPRGVSIRLWDVEQGQERSISPDGWVLVSGVVFSPDGRFLIANNERGQLRVWVQATGQEWLRVDPPAEGVWPLLESCFSPDGRFLIVQSFPQNVDAPAMSVWEVETKRLQATLKGRFGEVVFAQDGKRFAAARHGPNGEVLGVHLWQLGHRPAGVTLVRRHDLDAALIAFTRNLEAFATAAYPNGWTEPAEITVWDLTTGAVRARITHSNAKASIWLYSLTFSPDGRFLTGARPSISFGDGRRTLSTTPPEDTVWEANSLRTVRVFPHSTLFSPDGKWLLVGDPMSADLLETTGFEHRGSFFKPVFRPPSVAIGPLNVYTPPPLLTFSPDSKTVLATRLSHQPSESLLRYVRKPLLDTKRSLKRVGFLPPPAAARLWDVETARELAAFDGCRQALFSPDGKTLAAAYQDGTIRIWDVPPRKPVGFILGLSAALWTVIVAGAWLLRRSMGSGRAVGEPPASTAGSGK